MCGITGKLSFRAETPDAALIRKMADTIIHRGPDDEGIYTAPHIALAQRRLAIIDLNPNAKAPLANEDGTVWVTFNGEIYNFQELKKDLIARGHRFRVNSDTEVIVHLYEEYGTECLSRMRGMFAFALWDQHRKILFAARDRLGKKPFYYTRTNSAFIFGSEIKAITADPEVSVAPNYAAIDQCLTWQYIPSPLTAFEGISKLPPGHYLIAGTDGSLKIEKYWEPPLEAEKLKLQPAEIEAELRELLRESVRLRMTSDVPLGAFLSGGIDSGTVVALMAQESSRPVKTFSIGFEDEQYNELPYARLMAERYGTEHHEYIVKPDVAEVLPLLVRHYNEPFADSSALPTYYVSRMTRQEVTVALSGDGGDEIFAGYNHYEDVARWERVDVVPTPVRRVTGGMMTSVLEAMPYSNAGAKLARGFQMAGGTLPERYALQMSIVKAQEKEQCYTTNFRRLISGATAQAWHSLPWHPAQNSLDWMMWHDQHFYLPDCLTVKVDIASMANSLEVRCPLMDHKFVEFAARIPTHLKAQQGVRKKIFKEAFGSLLPAEILSKPKTGFAVPLGRWFRTELAGMLRETLLGERAAKRNLFNREAIRAMLAEQQSGRRDWSNRLWAFLFLELWFREFID
ncbi:MAG TPA: asparagine synthase (glutamine-hydrolyzing) [Blastocatellia bacterium]|nr:asparagine synthase (glutamine-hydrolyzing) [Blastocatellia bacterium]